MFSLYKVEIKESEEKVIDKTIWRILRISRIFDYWYYKFMNELLYDLQLLDLEQKNIIEKYHKKLVDFKKKARRVKCMQEQHDLI